MNVILDRIKAAGRSIEQEGIALRIESTKSYLGIDGKTPQNELPMVKVYWDTPLEVAINNAASFAKKHGHALVDDEKLLGE